MKMAEEEDWITGGIGKREKGRKEEEEEDWMRKGTGRAEKGAENGGIKRRGEENSRMRLPRRRRREKSRRRSRRRRTGLTNGQNTKPPAVDHPSLFS